MILRELLSDRPGAKGPFWAPPERFDRYEFKVFSLLIAATLVAAYLGTLLSQTMTFVAAEFGQGPSVQGQVIAATRVGAVISLLSVQAADKRGRRSMLLATGTVAVIFSVLSGFATSIWTFGIAQTIARGASTAFAILIGIVASEECPARSRAWLVSVLALFAGLGSGMVVWFLPLAGASTSGWRWLYFAALLSLAVIVLLAKELPETRRFRTQAQSREPVPISPAMLRRFALLAVVALGTSIFSAPASNFQNEFLKTERGFGATQISLFALATNTPIGLGVAFFGPLADRRGRRLLGFMGIILGVGFAVVRYSVSGSLMWLAGTAGTVLGSAVIPALGVYGPELFPTSRRAMANGLLTMVGVAGSALGLVLAGFGIERLGYSTTFALLAVVPVLCSVAIIGYPETAGKTLEELNPEDNDVENPLR